MRYLLIAYILMLPVTLIAGSDNRQSDELISAAKGRLEVLKSLNKDAALQLALPPKYLQCLFAAFSEAQVRNEYAHKFILEEIDYLYEAGLTTDNIIGLFSYGHSISNIYYGSSAGKSIAQISADDLPEIREFNKAIFYKNSCTDFAKESHRNEVKALIEIVIK